mmetsp:Transcript_28681/g.39446  ORF Transcript_28681/g.39446 Transcript_28681/m.39446 type:complete len:266 (-) Transcript_28681:391-1188(-)
MHLRDVLVEGGGVRVRVWSAGRGRRVPEDRVRVQPQQLVPAVAHEVDGVVRSAADDAHTALAAKQVLQLLEVVRVDGVNAQPQRHQHEQRAGPGLGGGGRRVQQRVEERRRTGTAAGLAGQLGHPPQLGGAAAGRLDSSPSLLLSAGQQRTALVPGRALPEQRVQRVQGQVPAQTLRLGGVDGVALRHQHLQWPAVLQSLQVGQVAEDLGCRGWPEPLPRQLVVLHAALQQVLQREDVGVARVVGEPLRDIAVVIVLKQCCFPIS